MRTDGADAAAAVPQEPQAEVSTQLCVLLKQQLWELAPRAGQTPVSPSPFWLRRSPMGTWAEASVCVLPSLAKPSRFWCQSWV